jgi:uncharacterized protein (TIGR00251 family)
MCGVNMKLLQVPEGTILEIRVKPKSRQFKTKLNDELVIFCRGTPVKGRVNNELVKQLSRLFKKKVEIVSGFTSKQKRVLVRDAEVKEIEKILKRGP